jgi:hypothetical protein
MLAAKPTLDVRVLLGRNNVGRQTDAEYSGVSAALNVGLPHHLRTFGCRIGSECPPANVSWVCPTADTTAKPGLVTQRSRFGSR